MNRHANRFAARQGRYVRSGVPLEVRAETRTDSAHSAAQRHHLPSGSGPFTPAQAPNVVAGRSVWWMPVCSRRGGSTYRAQRGFTGWVRTLAGYHLVAQDADGPHPIGYSWLLGPNPAVLPIPGPSCIASCSAVYAGLNENFAYRQGDPLTAAEHHHRRRFPIFAVRAAGLLLGPKEHVRLPWRLTGRSLYLAAGCHQSFPGCCVHEAYRACRKSFNRSNKLTPDTTDQR